MCEILKLLIYKRQQLNPLNKLKKEFQYVET